MKSENLNPSARPEYEREPVFHHAAELSVASGVCDFRQSDQESGRGRHDCGDTDEDGHGWRDEPAADSAGDQVTRGAAVSARRGT